MTHFTRCFNCGDLTPVSGQNRCVHCRTRLPVHEVVPRVVFDFFQPRHLWQALLVLALVVGRGLHVFFSRVPPLQTDLFYFILFEIFLIFIISRALRYMLVKLRFGILPQVGEALPESIATRLVTTFHGRAFFFVTRVVPKLLVVANLVYILPYQFLPNNVFVFQVGGVRAYITAPVEVLILFVTFPITILPFYYYASNFFTISAILVVEYRVIHGHARDSLTSRDSPDSREWHAGALIKQYFFDRDFLHFFLIPVGVSLVIAIGMVISLLVFFHALFLSTIVIVGGGIVLGVCLHFYFSHYKPLYRGLGPLEFKLSVSSYFIDFFGPHESAAQERDRRIRVTEPLVTMNLVRDAPRLGDLAPQTPALSSLVQEGLVSKEDLLESLTRPWKGWKRLKGVGRDLEGQSTRLLFNGTRYYFYVLWGTTFWAGITSKTPASLEEITEFTESVHGLAQAAKKYRCLPRLLRKIQVNTRFCVTEPLTPPGSQKTLDYLLEEQGADPENLEQWLTLYRMLKQCQEAQGSEIREPGDERR